MIRIVSVGAAVLLAAAIFPWPYGYYQALRLIVFASGIYCGIEAKSAGEEKLAYGLWITALVFNPVFPVHLTREIWMPINLAGSALFAFTSYRLSTTRKA